MKTGGMDRRTFLKWIAGLAATATGLIKGKGLTQNITSNDPEEIGIPPLTILPLDPNSHNTAVILEEFIAKANKILLGIATNSSTANFTILMQKILGVDPKDLFSTIVTSDIIVDKKPSPEVYIRALSNLELSPNNCVAIEDTTNGNISALNAGLPTVITTHAYTIDNDFTGSSLVLSLIHI